MTRVSPEWLALREPADAAGRSLAIIEHLPNHLPPGSPTVIFDLGCGTGSMARWLAPKLPGPQHWILCDQDADLLKYTAAEMAVTAADGTSVTVEARQCDITQLTADDFATASLVTASALLDILTADEVGQIAAACIGAGVPALLTLSVIGKIELHPPHPLDAAITEGFNAHQRRTTDGRRLLGPDAVDVAVEAFQSRGAMVAIEPSPWRLDPAHAALAQEWLTGWVSAASEADPQLTEGNPGYLDDRLAQAREGRLGVVVHHSDLFAICE